MPTRVTTTVTGLALRKRRIIPRIARCGVEPKNRLGRYRWVVERTPSWLNRFRRLKVRYEHRADIHPAFLQLDSLAAHSPPCVSSANHVQLARTVGLDRRARPLVSLLY